jgi:hypothetical protein
VPIENTLVRLVCPEGFTAPVGARALSSSELETRVDVDELDRSRQAVVAQMEEEERTDLGVRILGRSDLVQDGRDATRIDVRIALDGELFRRFALVLGEGEQSALITCTCPEARAEELAPLLESVLASVVWDRGREVDPFAGQLFRLDPPPGFELWTRAPDRVVLRRGGASTPTHADPRIVVEALPGRVGALDELAAEKVHRLGFLRAIERTGAGTFSSPAGSGARWTYRALLKKENTNIAVAVFAVPAEDATIVALLLTGSESGADSLAELERSMEGLTRTRP